MIKRTLLAATLIAAMASPAFAGSGSFRGASNHVTKGSVTVTESGGKMIIKLGSNFSLDGAPDPWVTLGNSSRPVKGGTAGILRKIKGAGTYSVPATATTKKAKQVVIWCKKFGVPLGVANIK